MLPVVLIVAPTILVLLQPNLGTSLMLIMAGAAVMFAAGVSLWYFAGVISLGVAAVAVLGSSLDHVLSTPRNYGIDWDVRVIDTQARLKGGGTRCGAADTRLTDMPTVEAVANACSLSITVGHNRW